MLVRLLLKNKIFFIVNIYLLFVSSIYASKDKKFSISLGYPYPLSYFENRVPYLKFGIGYIGVKYKVDKKYSLKLNCRYILSSYYRANKVELQDTSILARGTFLT